MNSDCSVVSLREGRQQQQQSNVERQFRKLTRHLSIYQLPLPTNLKTTMGTSQDTLVVGMPGDKS